MSEEDPQHFLIQGADGPQVRISHQAVQQSRTLANLVANLDTGDDCIPINNISGETIEKVAAWCEHHKNDETPTEMQSDPRTMVVPEWDTQFLNVSNGRLHDLVVAANYLDIKALMNYACRKVADMTIGKSTAEMRVLFGINTDEQDAEEAAKRGAN